jgi:ubiquinone biosynthesis protein
MHGFAIAYAEPPAPPRVPPTRLMEHKPEVRTAVDRFGRLRPAANVFRVTYFVIEMLLAWLIGGRLVVRNARRARLTIESLGGLWLKLGQLISLRRDLLPAAYCEELASLQDRAFGFSTEIARAIVERELKMPIDSLFSEFEDKPLGAASIAQVHRARLKFSGERVVVKIQRPDIQRQAERTLRWIDRMVRALVWLDVMPYFEWREMATELRETALEELDFRIEGTSLRRMRKYLKEDKVVVPRTYPRWTTRTVLVMEFIDGVFMTDYVTMLEQDPARVAEWERENGVDRRLVAKRLYVSLARQLFKRNLFHADMHPGNIILLRDSRVALIDFGSVGFLDAEFLTSYRFFLEAISDRNYGGAADLLFLLVSGLPDGDISTIRAEVVAKFRAWEMRANTDGLAYHERSLTSAVSDVFLSLARHRIALSWSFLRVDRAELTLDASLMYLDPDRNYVKLLRKTFVKINSELLARELQPEQLSERVGRFVIGLMRMTRDFEERVSYVTRQVRQSVQVYRATASKFAELTSWMVKGAAYALVAAIVYLVILLFWKRDYVWAHDVLGPDAGTGVFAQLTPEPYSWWWFVVLGGVAACLKSTLSVARRFSQRSSRSPQRPSDIGDLF